MLSCLDWTGSFVDLLEHNKIKPPKGEFKMKTKSTTTKSKRTLPKAVSRAEWQRARSKLLAKEKAATRARDALAAERRRLPMVKIEKDYVFEGPAGKARLLDLFEGAASSSSTISCLPLTWTDGRRPAALAVRCSSTTSVTDPPARPGYLLRSGRARTAGADQSIQETHGLDHAWFSSSGSDFNVDFGVTTEESETFGLSVFLREGESVFHTYFTAGRGVEALGSNWTFLDLTPLGRQENWENSPVGWPQTAPYQWWRRHDEYR